VDIDRKAAMDWNAELVDQLEEHREIIHHGAEICLLRDLYPWRDERRDERPRNR
jgi:hypothetical protein